MMDILGTGLIWAGCMMIAFLVGFLIGRFG